MLWQYGDFDTLNLTHHYNLVILNYHSGMEIYVQEGLSAFT